jgi:hypothetical protein
MDANKTPKAAKNKVTRMKELLSLQMIPMNLMQLDHLFLAQQKTSIISLMTQMIGTPTKVTNKIKINNKKPINNQPLYQFLKHSRHQTMIM